jgi:hypothetical protein
MSHVADGLIGSMTYQQPYNQAPPIYGAPQYLQPYGGPYYYTPPTYQQPYTVSPPPPMGGPSLVPIMRPASQRKSLLSSLGAIDPTNTRLTPFYLDSGEPCLPILCV